MHWVAAAQSALGGHRNRGGAPAGTAGALRLPVPHILYCGLGILLQCWAGEERHREIFKRPVELVGTP